MTDIKEVIARLKPFLEVAATYDSVKVTPADFRTLMHAAEAGIAARDAALEEAAKVAEAVDPEKPANWLHPRHKIAFAIRALKRRPA